jgi:acyl-CoA synthetase (AMP-forming)/AMP-acid ligase II
MFKVDKIFPENLKKSALIIPAGINWTYTELEEKVNNLSVELSNLGIGYKDRLAIVHPQDHAFVTVFFAALRIGAHLAPLNPAYITSEFEFYLDVVKPKLIIVSHDTPDEIKIAANNLHLPLLLIDNSLKLTPAGSWAKSLPDNPSPDDTALFLHTSGTTGRPKGVPLRHRNLAASIKNISGALKLKENDTSLCVMPLFHIHGLMVSLFSPLSTGGTVVLAPRFSASNFWKWVCDFNVNWYSAVPTIHQVLLSRADEDGAPKPAPFRFIRSSSSPLAISTFKALEERFGCPVIEAYGMTEASHQIATNLLPPNGRKAGTVGMGYGVNISIIGDNNKILPHNSEGEVVIIGPNVIDHYENNIEANKSSFIDGWFRTGDIGVLNKDGYLTLLGRIKELINKGGEKISPAEIDQVLLSHNAVKEAASFPFPDKKYGEVPAAAVVLKKDIDEQEILDFCSKHLSSFKVPSKIFILNELPKNATGKIQRKELTNIFKGKQ